MFDLEWGFKVQFLSVEPIGLYSTIITSETIILCGLLFPITPKIAEIYWTSTLIIGDSRKNIFEIFKPRNILQE